MVCTFLAFSDKIHRNDGSNHVFSIVCVRVAITKQVSFEKQEKPNFVDRVFPVSGRPVPTQKSLVFFLVLSWNVMGVVEIH